MKPIKWAVRRVKADPGRIAKRFVAGSPREGVVFLLEPANDAASLRFSAVAACGSETALLFGLIAAFSVSEGIRKDTGIISWVRWPNFITIDEKVVSTASASVTRSIEGGWVQLDLRVNLSHTEVTGATSLFDALGVEVDRGILLDKILESLSWMHFGWSNGMHPQLLRRMGSMTETVGTKVSVLNGIERFTGSALEIDALGRLVLQLDDGRIMKLETGDELLGP
ncbi:MAG: hypothetical protein OK454_01705 [Thaumarchaeota archaeon]|nr:hypothetical protein [Nitrososphaerota archaeon]